MFRKKNEQIDYIKIIKKLENENETLRNKESEDKAKESLKLIHSLNQAKKLLEKNMKRKCFKWYEPTLEAEVIPYLILLTAINNKSRLLSSVPEKHKHRARDRINVALEISRNQLTYEQAVLKIWRLRGKSQAKYGNTYK